ncbi:cytochrome P450 [Massilia sp. H-1]|nr:cytochrome P450 [Massilia sp. H-1]
MATRDALCEGAWIKAGDMVVAPTALYGLDDERFPRSADGGLHAQRRAPRQLRPGRAPVPGRHPGAGRTAGVSRNLAHAHAPVRARPGRHRAGWAPAPVASMLSLPLVWQADQFTFNHPKE